MKFLVIEDIRIEFLKVKGEGFYYSIAKYYK